MAIVAADQRHSTDRQTAPPLAPGIDVASAMIGGLSLACLALTLALAALGAPAAAERAERTGNTFAEGGLAPPTAATPAGGSHAPAGVDAASRGGGGREPAPRGK